MYYLITILHILCAHYSASMSCTIWQVEYPGNLRIALSMLLTAVFTHSHCHLEVFEAINHCWAVNHKTTIPPVPGCPCGWYVEVFVVS